MKKDGGGCVLTVGTSRRTQVARRFFQLRKTFEVDTQRLRVKVLEESGYLDKAGIRDTQAGDQGTLYQLTTRAHVTFFLNQINLGTFINEADEETLIAELAALTLFFEKTPQKDKTKD